MEIHNKYHSIGDKYEYNEPFIFTAGKKIKIISTAVRINSVFIDNGKIIYKTNIDGLFELVVPKTKHSGLDSHGEIYTILTADEIEEQFSIEQPFQYE